jgi:UDP-N-acetylglucosamine diphosphorylase / glucose-1-phosphate thymidylyltransferase / UDP-N-acetylgalactosamine diphosphorylase / glucosamine-1-phosphate N-acetyltransferase / galactosamine-1-phosphate N-acetyltransferase
VSLLKDNIAGWDGSPLAEFGDHDPWELTTSSPAVVERLIAGLNDDYRRSGDTAIHRSAVVEDGALLKGPVVIGANCFIASGSLVRGGCWIDHDCIIGPGAELKSSFVFHGSKLAHFNFVGDSVLGARVNLEAGSIIANYRNELPKPEIIFMHDGVLIETQVQKFGALVGDEVRVGANAVVAPGAILSPRTLVRRLTLVDQRPAPTSA